MPRQFGGVLAAAALAVVGAACGGKGTGVISPPTASDAGALDANADGSSGVVTPIADAGIDATVPTPVDAAADANANVDATVDASGGADANADANVATDAGDASGEDDAGTTAHECIPGQSIGCVGPGGCVTNQVCNSDGSGYGPCTCVGDASALACVPGQSIVCGGPGGCTSFQVCESNGSGYGPCNCPDAGVVDASVGWSPAQLPGLALWLDDTYGIVMDPSHAGSVLHWLDRSGNGNEATMNGAYSSSGVVASWYGFPLDAQGVNGFDGVLCPSGATVGVTGVTSISIAASPSLDWGSGDFGIAMVVKPIDDTPIAIWTGNGPTLNANLDAQGFVPGAFNLRTGSAVVAVTTPSAFNFATVIGRGQSLALDVGGLNATGPVNTTTLLGGTVRLSQSYASEYAEVIAVKGALSDANVANLKAYFHAKFGL